MACSFLYLATQLPTVWGTRSYDEATEEMVRSFTSDLTHHLRRAPRSISLLAWDLSYRLTGRKTPPVRETPRTPLGCLMVMALLGRTRTVSWRAMSLMFSVGVPWAVVVALLTRVGRRKGER